MRASSVSNKYSCHYSNHGWAIEFKIVRPFGDKDKPESSRIELTDWQVISRSINANGAKIANKLSFKSCNC